MMCSSAYVIKKGRPQYELAMIHLDIPGQRIRDGSGRNTPEVTGTWKRYSGRKISGFFPVHSDHFPVLFTRNRPEIAGKNPEIFRLECCFHVPVTSNVFLQYPAVFPSLFCRFLRDPVTGIFDLGYRSWYNVTRKNIFLSITLICFRAHIYSLELHHSNECFYLMKTPFTRITLSRCLGTSVPKDTPQTIYSPLSWSNGWAIKNVTLCILTISHSLFILTN